MTPTSPPTPAVELGRRSGVEQSSLPGEGTQDQRRVHAGVELDLGPVPHFVRLVRAVKSGERSQIDKLREQLSGVGWSIKHQSESVDHAVDESTSLTSTANQAGPIDSRSAKRATKPTRAAAEIPLDQRLTWDLNDIASVTGLSRRHFERFRQDGRMPAPDAKCGRRILWFPKTIRMWLERGGSLR